jgi:hypothetical protein
MGKSLIYNCNFQLEKPDGEIVRHSSGAVQSGKVESLSGTNNFFNYYTSIFLNTLYSIKYYDPNYIFH